MVARVDEKSYGAIALQYNIPKSTIGALCKRTYENTYTSYVSVFSKLALRDRSRPGRPEVLDERDKRRLIRHATKNQVQRFMLFLFLLPREITPVR